MPEPLFEAQVEGSGAHALAGADLARELTGTLPCARCRYNLKGLSVRNECPECGLPVRATLLAVIDPHASEIQPMTRPRLTGVLIATWAVAMMGVAASAWTLRLGDVFALVGMRRLQIAWMEAELPWVIAFLTVLAGVGAVGFVCPHAGIARRKCVMAALAAFLYLPLAAVEWGILEMLDGPSPFRYFGDGATELPMPERSMLRIASGLLISGIALLLRPNARLFVARSMLMRSGKVDRQTLMGIAGAAGVGVLGDLVHLAAPFMGVSAVEPARYAGTILIALSSALLTAGLLGVLVDTLRIYPSVVDPPLALEDVLAEPHRPAGAGT